MLGPPAPLQGIPRREWAMPDSSSAIPEITEADLEWARALLRLKVFDSSRRAFLTARNTVDVSACPGSGKTTLIVAKLAILARKWPHRTKGLCVLSHTNVARDEIVGRLGGTVVGQRLLAYPHFIGTIHGFVNRFLAQPWLTANGYESPTIDNEITTAYRRSALAPGDYWKLQSFLEKKYSAFDSLRICSRDLAFDLCGKAFPAGPSAPSYTLAKKAVEAAARAGYFCYDEMFVWADALLEDCPHVASWLRRRFPLVFIDEMQDTSCRQGGMLNAVFPRSCPNIVVQRVGDPNQAVFENPDTKPDENDPFPDRAAERSLEIPNSYRFGSELAALASPFAVMPVGTSGLCGLGPRNVIGAPVSCEHTIFMFPGSSTAGVLDAYGQLVLATFGDPALENSVVGAVGAVHRSSGDVGPGHPHFPKTVQHYWSGYAAEISRKDPHPRSLEQYCRAAQRLACDAGDLAIGVEKIAAGVVRLAGLIGSVGRQTRRARSHRAVVDALSGESALLATYRRLVKTLLIDASPLTRESWSAHSVTFLAIAGALCDGPTNAGAAKDYLEWPGDESRGNSRDAIAQTGLGSNVYRVENGGRAVSIRLGSIHSVKGQTHLATLLLSTYWYEHSSLRILPWLLGDIQNGSGAKAQDRTRLLQTYVAMTRPTHLICLAVPRSIAEQGNGLAENVGRLRGRGWRVVEVDSEAEDRPL